VEQPFDLQVQVSSTLTNALVPTQIESTLTVVNNGPETTTGIVATNTLFYARSYLPDLWPTPPAGSDMDLHVTVVGASQGQAAVFGNRVHWELGALEGFGKATLQVSASATQAGVTYSLATVAADQPDPDLRNNQCVGATLLTDAPLLTIQKLSKGTVEVCW